MKNLNSNPIFKIAATLLVILFYTFSLAAQLTPAGTNIQNIVEGNFRDANNTFTKFSNQVEAIVQNLPECGINLTPNGTVAAPASTQTITTGGSVKFIYDLFNTGELASEVSLSAILESGSSFTPTSLSIAADTDSDGTFETIVTNTLALALNAQVKLQLTVEVPNELDNSTAYINLVAKCTSTNNEVFDNDNVVKVVHEAPVKQLAQIDGFVWNDLNGNGIQDENELGLAGATINIYDNNGNLVATTKTNSNGFYSLEVAAGSYYIEYVAPNHFYNLSPANQGSDDKDSDALASTNPSIGRSPTFNVGEGEALENDVGFYQATNIEIKKVANVSEAKIGENVTYTITVINHGPNMVFGATVSDTLPTGLVNANWTCVTSGSSACSAAGTGNINDTVNIMVGEDIVYTLTATVSEEVTPNSTLENVATVTLPSGVIDTTESDNNAKATITISQITADVSIVKSSNTDVVIIGDSVSYSIVVTNNGPDSVEGLTVNDTMPELLEEVTWSCVASEGSNCTTNGTGDILDTVSILNGGSLNYNITAKLAATAPLGENLVNIASIAVPANIIDPNLENNTDSESDIINRTGIEQLSKTAEPVAGAAIKPNQELSYNISFDIINSAAVNNVRVTDVISNFLNREAVIITAFVNSVATTPDVLDYNAETGNMLVVFNTLPAGAHVEVVITAPVRADAPADAPIRNDGATVEWDKPNSETNSETSPAVVNPVAYVCDLLILPDGSVSDPAEFPNDVVSAPGNKVLLPYSITNTGNGNSTYKLTAVVEEESTVSGFTPSIYLDINADGTPDGEAITEVTVAANETVNLLVVVDLPAGGESLSGDTYINLIGECPEGSEPLGELASQDDNNVSHIFIPQGGIQDFDKKLVENCPENDPTSKLCQPVGKDTKFYANADVNYQIRFKVGGRDLNNVTISDLIDINLLDSQPPLRFDELSIVDANGNVLNIQPSSSSYTAFTPTEAAANPGHSGTVKWTFNNLPANSEIVLIVRSTVKAEKDWLPNSDGSITIDNNACIIFDGVEDNYCVETHKQGLDTIIGLQITKTAAPTVITPGVPLNYTLDVKNPSQAEISDSGIVTTLEDVKLYDPLPKGVTYKPGTAKITLPDGTAQDCAKISCEPTIVTVDSLVKRPIDYLNNPDSVEYQNLARIVSPEYMAAGIDEIENFLSKVSPIVLFWQLPILKPGQNVVISFDTDVDTDVVFGQEFVNHANALAVNSRQFAVAVSADSAVVTPKLEHFDTKAVLTGTAFVDNDGNGILSDGDAPVANLRLYLPNGVSILTDEAGRYTFLDLNSGVTTLKVDQITVPNLRFQPTLDEEAPGFWRIRLFPSILTRQDIPFAPAYAAVSIDEQVKVSRGPVDIEKNFVIRGNETIVTLSVSSNEFLNDLVIEDVLPVGAELVSSPVYKDSAELVNTNGLTLALGNVPAGFAKTIVYRLAIPNQERPALTTPNVLWELL